MGGGEWGQEQNGPCQLGGPPLVGQGVVALRVNVEQQACLEGNVFRQNEGKHSFTPQLMTLFPLLPSSKSSRLFVMFSWIRTGDVWAPVRSLLPFLHLFLEEKG